MYLCLASLNSSKLFIIQTSRIQEQKKTSLDQASTGKMTQASLRLRFVLQHKQARYF